MNKVLLGAAAGAAMALAAGSASAATYVLNVDGCTGGCGHTTYGTITTTGEGTNTVSFDIELDPGVFFNQAGGGKTGIKDDVWWDLVGSPAITVSGIDPSAKFLANGAQSAGSHNTGAFGPFAYTIQWAGSPKNNGNLPSGGVQSLKWTITGAGPLTLAQGGKNGDLWAVVDVATGCAHGTCATTGHIGATLAVPEPATWAMMLMGFGGLGAALRRRRNVQAAVAA